MPLSESQVIDCLRASGFHRQDVELGIGDDAAVLRLAADEKLVVCADAIVEGVHFLPTTAAGDIAWRALAVNLSDFAAMAAEPRWATLILAMPAADDQWVRDFATGFAELANRYQVALVGGDTVRGALNVGVNLLGAKSGGSVLLRSGACVGDDVWVTGTLGDAAAGLALEKSGRAVKADCEIKLRHRFLRPEPRVQFGQQLAGIASAAIDVSDGLLRDAQRLAQASGKGMLLQAESLPLSADLRTLHEGSQALRLALTGGDDYELLFTAKTENEAAILRLAKSGNMSCTRIGAVIEGQTVTYALEGKAWMPSYTGFDHFAEQAPT